MANNQKKTAALVALADSKTLSEAAGKAGISPRTLYTYIHDDLEFSKAYRNIFLRFHFILRTSFVFRERAASGM